MIFMFYKIRVNQRYSYFAFDWNSLKSKTRKKILNLITTSMIIFCMICMIYFPVMYILSVFFLAILMGFAGICLLLGGILAFIIYFIYDIRLKF